MIPVIFILALFAGAAQAGKRGLAWPWCECERSIPPDNCLSQRFTDNKPLNPALFNTAGHQVVAM